MRSSAAPALHESQAVLLERRPHAAASMAISCIIDVSSPPFPSWHSIEDR